MAETAEGESPRRYVVGWQRYTVHSVDEVTYETRWNVIYTRMRGVGPNEGKLSGKQMTWPAPIIPRCHHA